MKKRARITGIILLSFFALLLTVIFVLPYLLSLDKYKGMVEQKLEEALRRDVSLGNLRITILPTLGAKIENIVISNPPGFSQTPFLSLQSLKVRVKIIPLLFGRKEIAGLSLNKPLIFIEKDPQGRLNIPRMEEAGTKERKGTLESGKIKTDQSKALQGLYLAKASIKGGKFIYLDRSQTSARRTEIEKINFDLKDLSLDKKIRYTLSLQWSPGELLLDGWIGPLGETIDLKNIPMEGRLQADFPKLSVLMNKQSGGEGSALEGVLKSVIDYGGNIGSSLKVKGEILLKGLSLGEKGDRTIEDLTLTLRPEADISGGGEQLRINATLHIDKTPIVIHGQFRDLQKDPVGELTFSAPQGINLAELVPKFPALNNAMNITGELAMSGDLKVPAHGTPLLSLDATSEYMKIALKEEKKGKEKETSSKKKPTEQKQGAKSSPLDAKGRVTVKKGTFQGTDFNNLLVTGEMKDGEVRITRFTCAAFQGILEGTGNFNVAQEPSPFNMKTKVTGVDASALLSSFTSAKGMLKGKFNGDVTLSGAGFSLDTLKENLTGTGTVQIKEGELTWLNLISRVVQAAGGKGVGKEKTTFDDLTSAFSIKNGMINIPNLLISEKDMDIKLFGDIGLDLKLKMEGEAYLPSSMTGDLSGKGLKFFADQKGRLTIPFSLTGNMSNPQVGLSTRFIQEGAKGALQEFLQKRRRK